MLPLTASEDKLTSIIALQNDRISKLRGALEAIENLGAENPHADMSTKMFRLANDALVIDDAAEH